MSFLFVGTKFKFNNQSSEEFGVSLVRIDSGMLNRPLGLKRTINKEKIRYKDTPFYFGSDKETYQIDITIAKINYGDTVWTQEDRLSISRWLFTSDNQFHEFESEDNPEILYFLQFIDAEYNHNYNDEGYLVLKAEMKFPYPLTRPTYINYDLSDNTTTTIIEIENRSNVVEYYYPLIEIELKGDSTSFKIKNLSANGEETIFNNLTQNEILNVDNENQQIISSTGNERVSNFNFIFTRLNYGLNRLEITGKCNLTFKCSFPVML
jgi:hypothetical protein